MRPTPDFVGPTEGFSPPPHELGFKNKVSAFRAQRKTKTLRALNPEPYNPKS